MRRLLLAAAALLLLAGCRPGPAPESPGRGPAFLALNARAADVKTLPSGLQYRIIRSGPADGLRPRKGDEVKVHYEGKLLSGQVFDSSYERGVPAALPLNGLIPAWIEALPLMRPGDEWILYVPPGLGYGEAGQGDIPPDSVLIFRIELIAVLPGPGRIRQG